MEALQTLIAVAGGYVEGRGGSQLDCDSLGSPLADAARKGGGTFGVLGLVTSRDPGLRLKAAADRASFGWDAAPLGRCLAGSTNVEAAGAVDRVQAGEEIVRVQDAGL